MFEELFYLNFIFLFFQQLAETFANYGLCEQAVDCYLKVNILILIYFIFKCNRISDAFETCIKLNKWDRAAELSDRYQLANVENLLNQYAHQIVGNKTKNLAVAQLYSKAAKYLQAAKIVYEVK
jgi:amino acid permease